MLRRCSLDLVGDRGSGRRDRERHLKEGRRTGHSDKLHAAKVD